MYSRKRPNFKRDKFSKGPLEEISALAYSRLKLIVMGKF